MGILSNLFKQKSAGTKFEPRKSRYQSSIAAPDAAGEPPFNEESGNTADETAPDASISSEQPLKSISFGGSKKNTATGTVPQKKNITSTTEPGIVKSIRKAVTNGANTIPDKQIIIDLNDLLPQIPAQFLKADRPVDLKTKLAFKAHELLPALISGKASVPLYRIAELSPELFTDQRPGENVEIQLPLQKVVSQIGTFPCRPDQTEVQFPPLDSQYANLVIEKITVTNAKIDQPSATVPEPAESTLVPALGKTDTIDSEAVTENPSEPSVITAAQIVSEPASDIEEEIPVPFEPPVIDEKVSYSLAALLPNIPKSWLVEEVKSISDTTRITLPFHLVESQLVTGRVELPFNDFFHALPDDFKKYFSGESEESKIAKIQIPLNEVFQNLPGVEPLPPAPKPPVVEAQEQAEEIKLVSETTEAEPVSDANPHTDEVIKSESAIAESSDPFATPEQKIVEPIFTTGGAPEQPLTQEPANSVVENEPVSAQAHKEQKTEVPEPQTEVSIAEPEPVIESAQASVSEEAAKQEEPAEISEPVAISIPEPVGVQLPTYRDPSADPDQIAAALTPPKVQLQRLVPPSVFAKKISAAPPQEPAQEPEPGKILAFEGASLAFNPNAVETLFMTDGKLDPGKTVDHISHFPSVQGVALALENETTTAGDIPDSFNATNTSKAASLLFQTLENPSDQPDTVPARNITLNHSGFSSTWFKQGHILLGILHPQRSLEEAMHDKLVLVTGELAQLH